MRNFCLGILLVLAMMLIGCRSERKPSTWRERYLQDPEAYHEIIERLYEQIKKEEFHRRYILIDPNYITD